MQNQIAFLQSYYKNDKKNNGFVIDIALDSYTDIFNEYDPSPFKKRDLNPELLDYLEDCSTDIPLKYPIVIQFNLPKEKHDLMKETKIKDGFKSYYSFLSFSAEKDYKKLIIQNIYNVLISIFLLLAGFTLEVYFSHIDFLFTTILSNIIVIGGWVFMWQAISMMAFERRSYKEKYLKYKRFTKAPIEFNAI